MHPLTEVSYEVCSCFAFSLRQLYPACRCSQRTLSELFGASCPQLSSSLKEKALAEMRSVPLQLQYKSSGIFANFNKREKRATHW